MNILFEFSRQNIKEFVDIFGHISSFLHKNHLLVTDLLRESIKNHNSLPSDVFNKIKQSISKADAVIIEGSSPSLSIGYVLTKAIEDGKPVLFLIYKPFESKKNRFVMSIKSKLLIYKTYNDLQELDKILWNFLEKSPLIKTRFNLVLERALDMYVVRKSKEMKISKTEYICNLIRNDMRT